MAALQKGKTWGRLAILSLTALLAASLMVLPSEAAIRERQLTISWEQGSADLFGRGQWIRVRAGDTSFGVFYGTPESPGTVRIFAEYTRFLGVAQVYDTNGNFLGRKPIPLRTFFGQSLDRLVEFVDVNEINTTEVVVSDTLSSDDIRVKAISLSKGWQLAGSPQANLGPTSLTLDFTLTLTDVAYDHVWDDSGLAPGSKLDAISITFHVNVTTSSVTINNVPVYRVTIDGDERRIVDVELQRTLTYNGTAVQTAFKYDHNITGWDFKPNTPNAKLALATHAFVGTAVPLPIAEWFHDHMADVTADAGNTTVSDDNVQVTRPTLITTGKVVFADNWYPIGHLGWVSDVTVDGQRMDMFFQIHSAERFVKEGPNRIFAGFRVFGAFIYPQGQRIFHDPEVQATAIMPDIPVLTNLTPLRSIVLQGAIIAGAISVVGLLAFLRRRHGPAAQGLPSTPASPGLPGP